MLPNKQTKLNLAILLMAAALCMAAVGYAAPMGTAFTYQGQLADANSPAEGLYDFEFEVYDALNKGSQQGSTLGQKGKDVIDGYFTVTLDFGPGVFTGDARWLQIAVRSPGAEIFTTLTPRQELTPTPYALYAKTAGADSHTHGDSTVSDNISINNNRLYAPTGLGNVGIGTSAPAAQLFIKMRSRPGPSIPPYRVPGLVIKGGSWNFGNKLEVQDPSGNTTFLVDNGGNVGIGTTDPGAKLGVNGQIKITGGSPGKYKVLTSDATGLATWQTPPAPASSALVPIGTVIDWWRPNDTFPVPDGYQICDGSVVNDAQSPFNGQTLPDLRTKFVMGTYVIGQMGQSGGSPQHNHTISGSIDSTVVTMGYPTSVEYSSLSLGAIWSFARNDHKHTTNSHNHGLSSLGSSQQSHYPPYVMLLKIMRIR